MKIRRVVTGQDASGKSVFVFDEEVTPVTLKHAPGLEFYQLWGTDQTPKLPSDGTPLSQNRYFPPPGGFRWVICTLPPNSVDELEACDFEALRNEATEKLPGLLDVLEDNRGMHMTDTVDVGLILSGEVALELDDGVEVTLGPGDTIVQNGTRHAWHNRGDAPVVIAFGLLGAQRPARSARKPE